jgi:hypothetical protein
MLAGMRKVVVKRRALMVSTAIVCRALGLCADGTNN